MTEKQILLQNQTALYARIGRLVMHSEAQQLRIVQLEATLRTMASAASNGEAEQGATSSVDPIAHPGDDAHSSD